MNPLVPSKELETTTVTLDEIVYHRRSVCSTEPGRPRSPRRAEPSGSRTTYYGWTARAERYGVAALMPKGRRSPAMPNALPPETVEIVLAESIARPTLGARRLLEHWPSVTSCCRPRPRRCRSAFKRLFALKWGA